MSLPAHLDYTEIEYQPHEWAPEVFCTVEGCRWTYAAAWDELGTDEYAADWDTLHPAHGVSCTGRNEK